MATNIPFVDFENQITPYSKPWYAPFRAQCEKFLKDIISPNINKWEKQGSLPKWVYTKAYEYGVYTPDYPNKHGGQAWQNHKWDYFMDIIRTDVFAKAGSGGLFTSLYVHKISVPPVLYFGSDEQKELFIPVLQGKKIAALAISEPGHGSDVAGIKTTAKLKTDASGQYYTVNGMKKWISNGMKADYYVTAVRTGGAGVAGVSLLIIPNIPGQVITSRIQTQGHKISETTMIIFRNVRVPKSYLIGVENEGFKLIMFNFNSERLGITMAANALAKCAFIEALQYAQKRQTFKRALIKHQVIRHKLAECGRRILATHYFVEKLAFELTNDPLAQQNSTLAANICLCKVDATRTMEFVAREASQILGGASYVLGGKKVERIYRDVRALAIYGGSEEIMLDVSLRLALKSSHSNADNLPYADWQNHLSTPKYYSENHHKFRAIMSDYVEKEILPNIDKWERNWSIDRSAYRIAYKYGVYAARYPTQYGGTKYVLGGDDWDQFYNMILYEQLARAGSGGLFSSLFIQTIAIPPVIHFGTEAQKKLFIPVIRGEQIACLAISEPGYGSDVANIKTTAVRDASGDYFVVNGMKKWISNGMDADYFVTAVRTGAAGTGSKGISLLIIARKGNEKNIITSRILTQGHHTSHTTMIIFRDVRVPVSYLIGAENKGFALIMYNFNQERFGIACQATQLSRIALQESVSYAKKRRTFGKQLIKHQVIRHKLAEMGRQIMSTYCFMERLAFSLQTDPLGRTDKSIPANIALFKVQATKMLEFVAREASQIHGGASYVEGKIIERIYRDVRAFAIYGGSEEIMLDVSLRLSKL